MRMIPAGLASHLAGEVTTLARCWLLTRRDGVVMGFTDHDRDLVLDDVTCEATSGLDASEVETALGFAVGGGDVSGALISLRITEADLAQGRYDGATVTTLLVNWAETSQRLTLSRSVIGEIRRGQLAFTAELRSQAAAHDAETGRIYSRDCSADLGDSACGVPVVPVTATVAAGDGRLFLHMPLAAADGDFTRGLLTFTSGANSGTAHAIRLHRQNSGEAVIMLWQATAAAILPGDTVSLRPGCDKSFATCRARFGNGLRFRGFPHLPGNDFIVAGVAQGAVLDGRSLFR